MLFAFFLITSKDILHDMLSMLYCIACYVGDRADKIESK